MILSNNPDESGCGDDEVDVFEPAGEGSCVGVDNVIKGIKVIVRPRFIPIMRLWRTTFSVGEITAVRLGGV